MIPLGTLASGHYAAVGSAYRAAVLADSPYCYFPLDDASTPTDVMGNVTPSSVLGVTLGATGIGDGTTAASFDGSGSGRGITISSFVIPSTISALTIEVIAKASDMSVQRALFAIDPLVLLRHSSSSTVNAYTCFPAWANEIGTGYAEGSPTAKHHWAITWDGATARVYRDGTEVLSEAQAGPSGTNIMCSLYIGSRASSNPTFLGTMAGFAFYKTSLSAARIAAHATAAGL